MDKFAPTVNKSYFGFPLKPGQSKVKPFVASLSNHDRLNRPPIDKLRPNG